MDNIKWLKRKYPNTFELIESSLGVKSVEIIKNQSFKIGFLTQDLREGGRLYKAGKLCYFKRSNPINDYNYPLHTITVKCDNNVTESGYHKLWVYPTMVKEINK